MRYYAIFSIWLSCYSVGYALNDTTTQGDCSPIISDVGGHVTTNCTKTDKVVNNYGIPPEEYLRVATLLGVTKEKLDVTQKVFDSFLQTVGKEQVPLEKLDSTLTEIAQHYKELLKQVATFTSDDPEVKRLLTEAKSALDAGESDQAEKLYNQASELAVAAAKRSQEITDKQFVTAAEAKYANGELKMTQLAYLDAAQYYQQAAELLPEKYAKQLGLYLNDAGFAFHHSGHYAQALPLFQRGLAIREKVLGQEHPDVATSLNNLALLYQEQGKYAQALPLLQRSLAIREKVLGPEYPADVAGGLHNLATLYYTQGEYDKALPLYQRSLVIFEEALGKEHPNVATSLNNLASLYKAQGEYEKALPLHQRSLAIREKVLGPEHPDVALNLNNLALLYYAQGEYDQAKPLFERSLAIMEKVLGKEHPNVATSLNNLSLLHKEQGEHDKALPLYQRSLAIREKILGKGHPDVAMSLNNLGTLYYAQGEYDKALPLCGRAVAIAEKKLGKDHPDTKLYTGNLHQVQLHLDNPNAQFQVIVIAVSPDSQAEQLGIQVGDIFTYYDNQPVLDIPRFRNKKESAAGPAKELKVLQDGKELIFKIKPGKIGVELEEKVK